MELIKSQEKTSSRPQAFTHLPDPFMLWKAQCLAFGSKIRCKRWIQEAKDADLTTNKKCGVAKNSGDGYKKSRCHQSMKTATAVEWFSHVFTNHCWICPRWSNLLDTECCLVDIPRVRTSPRFEILTMAQISQQRHGARVYGACQNKKKHVHLVSS